ncbi:hypothetical protein, partial [Bradyrhizobium uaiense]|uniref:hypothetical protein n=1 Tax=Bradyrhizobium uaiense TaxID=2594946 RepID=UPI00322179B4
PGLKNLLSNAFKCSAGGGGSLTVAAALGGWSGGGWRGGGWHGGGWRGGYYRRGWGWGYPFAAAAVGFGLGYGAYDYYDGYYGNPYYAGYGYDDGYGYGDGGCYVVRRRMLTPYGWQIRPVQVCN